MRRPVRALTLTAAAGLFAAMGFGVTGAIVSGAAPTIATLASDNATATPIKHLVVIFDENVSFDHYFGTYPYAANLAGAASARGCRSSSSHRSPSRTTSATH